MSIEETKPSEGGKVADNQPSTGESASTPQTTNQSSAGATAAPAPSKASAPPTADASSAAVEEEEEEESRSDFGALLDQFEQEQAGFQEGEVVRGTVVGITERGVVIDFGYKSEGIVNQAEFMENGKLTVEPGDEVDVLVKSMETHEGYPVLSRADAVRMKAWDDLEKAYASGTPVRGRITDRIKGGLRVDIDGIAAFLPGSQIDTRPVRNLDSYRNQEVEAKVIKLNRKRSNVVLSRKAIIEEQNAGKKGQTLDQIEEDIIVEGQIKNLTDYGAFVDLGGIDGLLHVTDMSWGRLQNPAELFKVGDTVQVKVLKFDRERERVSLGYKQLLPDPWETIDERFPIGTRITGKIASVTDYGAFVELEPGVEGLVHVSEMSWSKRVKHPSKLVGPGDTVEVEVLGVDPKGRRISLGMKQVQDNPWKSLGDRYQVGARVHGRVRNLTDFGAFIEIEEGVDGLVHVSDLSWTKRVKHPSEVLKKGDRVKAVVLAIDSEKRRLSLGVKQLQPDVWESFFANHHIGDIVHGKVLRVAAFGAFVEIAEGVEGLCHNSEAVDGNGQQIHLEPGLEHDFKIIKMSPEEKKVGLSIRAVGEEASRSEVESYKQPSSSTGSTIGELVSWKRAGNENG